MGMIVFNFVLNEYNWNKMHDDLYYCLDKHKQINIECVKMKKKIIKCILILFGIILIVFFFFRSQKLYVFNNINGELKDFFNEKQLKTLEKKDSVLALSVMGQTGTQKEIVNFHIFSIREFSSVKISKFIIIYDGQEKEIIKNIVYKVKTENPNFFRTKTYSLNNQTLQGFQVDIYGGFLDYEICGIDFNRLFIKKHKSLKEKFPVRIVVNYSLDNQEYSQELNYEVERVKVPYNLFYALLSKIY